MTKAFHPLDVDRIKTTYTFSEAIEFQKMLDTYPTHSTKRLTWVNSKTRKPVSIGYSG